MQEKLDKVLESKASYNAWMEQKKETFVKDKVKEKRMKEREERDKEREKLEKKREAEKVSIWASSGCPTKRVSNQSPQLQRLARKLKFQL